MWVAVRGNLPILDKSWRVCLGTRNCSATQYWGFFDLDLPAYVRCKRAISKSEAYRDVEPTPNYSAMIRLLQSKRMEADFLNCSEQLQARRSLLIALARWSARLSRRSRPRPGTFSCRQTLSLVIVDPNHEYLFHQIKARIHNQREEYNLAVQEFGLAEECAQRMKDDERGDSDRIADSIDCALAMIPHRG